MAPRAPLPALSGTQQPLPAYEARVVPLAPGGAPAPSAPAAAPAARPGDDRLQALAAALKERGLLLRNAETRENVFQAQIKTGQDIGYALLFMMSAALVDVRQLFHWWTLLAALLVFAVRIGPRSFWPP